VHIHWNAGDWDAVLQTVDQLDALVESTASKGLARLYINSVHRARGVPEEQFQLSDALTGEHGDLAIEMVRGAFEAAGARRTGKLDDAAAASSAALEHARAVSGIDDDFTLFWVTALDDQLAAAKLDEAERILAVIAEAPRGHVATLLRALVPFMRARLNTARGVDENVEADFRQAAEALRSFGAPFYLARTLVDHAEWLDGRGRVAEAMPIAAEARDLLAGLKATPWLERAQRLAGDSAPPTADLAALSLPGS
jgi:hypothetical protein